MKKLTPFYEILNKNAFSYLYCFCEFTITQLSLLRATCILLIVPFATDTPALKMLGVNQQNALNYETYNFIWAQNAKLHFLDLAQRRLVGALRHCYGWMFSQRWFQVWCTVFCFSFPNFPTSKLFKNNEKISDSTSFNALECLQPGWTRTTRSDWNFFVSVRLYSVHFAKSFAIWTDAQTSLRCHWTFSAFITCKTRPNFKILIRVFKFILSKIKML